MRRILFVGAPFGPFFKEFARELEQQGCRVWRAVFDGGDFLETPAANRIVFRGDRNKWSRFVNVIFRQKKIDCVVTFNDTLFFNSVALTEAKRLGIQRYVLENGYLRPFWVTFERDGVNGHSCLPAEIQWYLNNGAPEKPHLEFPARLRGLVVNTMRHYTHAFFLAPALPFDPCYYGDSIWRQANGYVRDWLWRLTHKETKTVESVRALAIEGRRVFVCLLQKPGDSQLVVHSGYGGNRKFISQVMRSFKEQAPPDTALIVKQHPLDYGIERCMEIVTQLATELGIQDRVFFLRQTSIDVVLPLTTAMVTINSTGGFAAVAAGLPVICLGNAFYDIAGLTYQGSLGDFWSNPVKPPMEAVRGFVAHVKATTQFNGGFDCAPGRKLVIPALVDALLKDSLIRHPASVQQRYQDESAPDLGRTSLSVKV
jgi:capsular polysaccharide export protein